MFDKDFFNEVKFNKEQIKNIFDSAKQDLNIAKKSDIVEVVFRFSYDALLKFGMYILANKGYKVRSIPGHHQKIIEQTSIILQDEYFLIVGEKMRRQRNFDLYECNFTVSQKDVFEYREFVSRIIDKYK